MKKLISTLILGVVFMTVSPLSLYSQILSDANITGHVIDKNTGEHLPFFTIKLLKTNIGVMTDTSGHYSLTNIEPGEYTIEASCVGYIPLSKSISIVSNKTVEVNFEVESDSQMLDQIVVTGSKTEQKRLESASLVNVLPTKIFDAVSACSLADGLNFQPGVRVENDCQNCGFTQVRINGLDGHYSQILMNSKPVFSALTGVYGLEQIPANMIARVEVMHGGGSALFGSSAIGGTINIITKDPLTNYAEVNHQIMSIGLSKTFDNNTTFNASVTGENNKIGLSIYGQNRKRDGYDHDGDGFTEIASINSQTLGARSYFRPTASSRLTAEYHGIHEYRRGGDNLDLPPHMAMVAEEVSHNINGGEISYDLWDYDNINRLGFFGAFQDTRRKSYYGSEQDPNAYGRTHDLVVTTGSQYSHLFSNLWFMPAQLMGGLEYNHNYLRDITIGYDHDVLQKIDIFSVYLQNEWKTEKWGFLVGARVDKHSLIKHAIISPRANIRYNPTENINLRLSYSTGFRSPQAYDEDFHVAIVGGERVVTVLAKNLKEEKSNSFSMSGDLYRRFGSIMTNLLIEGFYTDLSDVFALRNLNELDDKGNAVLERYNASGAYVMGINIETKAIFTNKSDFQGGITFQRSRYKNYEKWSENPEVKHVKKMFRTPDIYGYLMASYVFTDSFKAFLSATYTGSMIVQHLTGSGTPIDCVEKTESFFDAQFKLSYDFKLFKYACLELNVGINNIFNSYQKKFDQGYLRDSGYIYGPSLPRSVFASIKIHL